MPRNEAKQQFFAGMRRCIPVVLGFLPVGIAYAIMAKQAGFTSGETIFMSVAVYAGASQMMAAKMYAECAGIAAIVLATFILNLRHIIMSTCVVNRLPRGRVPLKMLAMFGVTDETFAILATEKAENCTLTYCFGVVIAAYLAWIAGTVLGTAASDFLPDIVSASFGIALYAMFIGLLVPSLRTNLRLALLVLFTAVLNTVLCQVIASSWALIASTLIGALTGVFFVDLKENGEEAADAK